MDWARATRARVKVIPQRLERIANQYDTTIEAQFKEFRLRLLSFTKTDAGDGEVRL